MHGRPVIRKSLDQTVFDEIVPTVHLPEEKGRCLCQGVYERFENPFVKHALLSISLNSISKWKARILPTFKDSLAATGKLPKWLTYSFAAFLAFYRTTQAGEHCLIGSRPGNTYEIHDDEDKLAFVKEQAGKTTADYVKAIMHAVIGGAKTCRLSTALPMPLRLIWTAWLKSVSKLTLPN